MNFSNTRPVWVHIITVGNDDDEEEGWWIYSFTWLNITLLKRHAKLAKEKLNSTQLNSTEASSLLHFIWITIAIAMKYNVCYVKIMNWQASLCNSSYCAELVVWTLLLLSYSM